MTHPNPGNTGRIHPVIDTPLGHLIQERRHAMGVSQSELARQLGLHESYISRIESGQKTLHPLQIQRVAAVMDLDAVDLALAIAGIDPAAARRQIVRDALQPIMERQEEPRE